MDSEADIVALPLTGEKSTRLDKRFFGPGQGAGHVAQPFHFQYSERGKELTGRKLKTLTAIEKDVDPAELRMGSKKHFKGHKKRAKKERSEYE
jgi:large subunit GTPase 1